MYKQIMAPGKAMKAARKAAKMSQLALAVEADTTQATISAWESEKNIPTMSIAIRVCNVLGIDVDEYYGRVKV